MRTQAWIAVVCLAIVGASLTTRHFAVAPAAPDTRYEPYGTVAEIMEGIIEPSSDAIFQSVATISTTAGTVDRAPRTDEEWAAVQHGALTLAEAANLLKTPGRRVEWSSGNAPGAAAQTNGPELTPAEIQDRIDADPATWAGFANALGRAAGDALQAANNRDVQGLFNVGGTIDQACENCHLQYWYPEAGRLRPRVQ